MFSLERRHGSALILTQQVEGFDLADNVHFSGPVSEPVPYPRAADALVLPSISEGMSNSLLEPMSRGLPAVVLSEGANVDLVKHEESDGELSLTLPLPWLSCELERCFWGWAPSGPSGSPTAQGRWGPAIAPESGAVQLTKPWRFSVI